MPRILLIDDEPAITESLAYALGRAGFETEAAASLEAGRRSLSAGDFDLMVLDLMLPDGNGLDWLRALRQRSNLPVIILSSHDDPVEHVVGLELGADDYIDKPFSPREVVARIRAVLRRTAAQGPETRTPEGFTVDEAKRLITANGQRLTLSKTEFDLLATFIASPGRVFERDQLLRRAWGSDVTVTERTVDVYIKALRKKLVQAGMEGNTIETVRGVGYRLAEPEQR
ncbi:MAG: response regulator transcription factor [Bradymonadia bacterium]